MLAGLEAIPLKVTHPMEMEYTQLGRSGLNVSVAGFGCGGNSRLGLGYGKSEAECVAIARQAIDLGVNFFDTAAAYGSEGIVGRAIKGMPRDQFVISTKAQIVRDGERLTPESIVESLEASLKRLQTDYVDVFHLHGVRPGDYDYALESVAPALTRQKAVGKIRTLGITETASRDVSHATLHRAVHDEVWEVVMLAFHMLNQNARPEIFRATQAAGIGTLLMFVVRNIFSRPGYLTEAVQSLIDDATLSSAEVDAANPLGFLVHDAGAKSLVDAAYRFARHEPGADVVLFGTGNKDHVAPNVASILSPPLPPEDVERLYRLFGHLEGIGLDAPDHLTERSKT